MLFLCDPLRNNVCRSKRGVFPTPFQPPLPLEFSQLCLSSVYEVSPLPHTGKTTKQKPALVIFPTNHQVMRLLALMRGRGICKQ